MNSVKMGYSVDSDEIDMVVKFWRIAVKTCIKGRFPSE